MNVYIHAPIPWPWHCRQVNNSGSYAFIEVLHLVGVMSEYQTVYFRLDFANNSTAIQNVCFSEGYIKQLKTEPA